MNTPTSKRCYAKAILSEDDEKVVVFNVTHPAPLDELVQVYIVGCDMYGRHSDMADLPVPKTRREAFDIIRQAYEDHGINARGLEPGERDWRDHPQVVAVRERLSKLFGF